MNFEFDKAHPKARTGGESPSHRGNGQDNGRENGQVLSFGLLSEIMKAKNCGGSISARLEFQEGEAGLPDAKQYERFTIMLVEVFAGVKNRVAHPNVNLELVPNDFGCVVHCPYYFLEALLVDSRIRKACTLAEWRASGKNNPGACTQLNSSKPTPLFEVLDGGLEPK